MAKAKSKTPGPWQQQNAEFIRQISLDPESKALGAGVYYKVVSAGTGDQSPQQFSVVTCHYKGSLINGRVFDNSYERGCPEAFRCRDLIAGFTLALLHMKVGDLGLSISPLTKVTARAIVALFLLSLPSFSRLNSSPFLDLYRQDEMMGCEVIRNLTHHSKGLKLCGGMVSAKSIPLQISEE